METKRLLLLQPQIKQGVIKRKVLLIFIEIMPRFKAG